MGCSSLRNHQVPSLCFRVNTPPSSSPSFPQEGPPPSGSPPPSLCTLSPRGGHQCFSTIPWPHPATSGEGTTKGFTPHLAPHLGNPGHPKPVGGRGSITSTCPPHGEGGHAGGWGHHLPADREDGDLTGATCGFGDLGGTEGWQHLGPLLLAAAGARGRPLHGVEVLLVPAGGGKLRQEVQPGNEGGDNISMGLVPPWGGSSVQPWWGVLLIWGGATQWWHRLLALMLLQQLLQRRGVFYGWGDTGGGEGGVTGVQSVSPPHPKRPPPDLSSQ